jgi:hypothetical protein
MSIIKTNISEVKPWWLRLIILVIIGLPPITGWPINEFTAPTGTLNNLVIWGLYSCFIWLFIWINMGGKDLLKFLSLAFFLAIMTAFFGAMFRYIHIALSGEIASNVEKISYKMMNIFVIMIAVIPYALLFISSFSATGLVSRISFKKSKFFILRLHIATALRVIQHVGEVTTKLLDVWQEENPKYIFPRHRNEMELSNLKIINWFVWFYYAVLTWCFALITHSFEVIPYITEEMRIIKNNRTLKS